MKLIADIEHAAANALPSAQWEHYDGWRLRYNFGVTRRANSVLAEQAGELALVEKLEHVEAWYAHLSVKARFQLCPASKPEGVQEVLLRRGYTKHNGANIQVANLEDILKASPRKNIHLEISDLANRDWLELYELTEQADPAKAEVRRQMFEQITLERAFVLATLQGKPAAVGLAVLEGDFVGVFNMATLPDMRKKGAASAVLLGMSYWAQQRAAKTMYLQVATENHVAQTVYEKFGFKTLYAYEYFEQA